MKFFVKFVLLTFLAIGLFAENSFALLMSTDDLWDISQGATVTDYSPMISSSYTFQNNMFGGTTSSSHSANTTVFSDSYSTGTVHWIEWQSAEEMTLLSFNLVANHDGGSRNMTYRGFSNFKLYAGDGTETGWSLIYSYDTDEDGNMKYDGGENYPGDNFLELAVDLDQAVTSQYFRAEFVQCSNTSASGPRIYELDGYDTYLDGTVPVPGTFILMGLGLMCIAAKRSES